MGDHRGKRAKKSLARSITPTKVLLDVFTAEDVDHWEAISSREQTFQDRFYYELEAQRAAKHSALCAALRLIPPTTIDLSACWWRLTDWTYNLTPLSSLGSVLGIGGRFNIGRTLDRARGHAFPCLYIAEDEETARAEKFGRPVNGQKDGLSTYELALRTPDAFVTFPLEGHVDSVLDLRDGKALKPFVEIIKRFSISANLRRNFPCKLITTVRELHKILLLPPDKWRYEPTNFGIPASSQIFGRFAKEAGFEGILFPSQRGAGLCMAIFPENFRNSNSVVRVRGAPPVGAIDIDLVLDNDNLCL